MKPISANAAEAADNAEDAAAAKRNSGGAMPMGGTYRSHKCPHCGKFSQSDTNHVNGSKNANFANSKSKAKASLVSGGVAGAQTAVKTKLKELSKRDGHKYG